MRRPRDNSSFAQRMKRLRKRAHVSLRAAAQYAEISPTYLSQVEGAERNPPRPDILRKLAWCYGVPPMELLLLAEHVRPEDLNDLQTNELISSFRLVLADPRVPADYLEGAPLPPELMQVIVWLYEEWTGKRLIERGPSAQDFQGIILFLQELVLRSTGGTMTLACVQVTPLPKG